MTRLPRSPIDVASIDPASDERLAARLLEIQHSSYRVEAELIGIDTIPQLHETVDALVAARLRWFGAFESPARPVAPELLGALAWSVTDDVFEIERLVVSPEHFRRGVARRLVGEAIESAAGRRIRVSTGRDNPPARRLYDAMGFVWVGDAEVAPSVHLARYERSA